jgi:thiamine-phosphate pyrophosphorylase
MLKDVLSQGVDVLQLRAKYSPYQKFLYYAHKLRDITKRLDIIFIINDRADIALASDADGLHLSDDDIPVFLARKILGKRIIGFSTHSSYQAKQAMSCEAIDYIGIGPVFKTHLKPKAKPIGLGVLRSMARKKQSKPYYAIGGINESNIKHIKRTGVKNVALSSAVFSSKDKPKAAKRLKGLLYDTD